MVEPPPQIGNQPLEVAPVRVRGMTVPLGAQRPGASVAVAVADRVRAEQDQVARLLRQLPERRVEVYPEVLPEGRERLAHQALVALRPRRDRALQERQRLVRHQPGRVEVVHGAEALALGTRPVGRVEGEGARRHLRHADAAIDAGQAPREQPVAVSTLLMMTMSLARPRAVSNESERRRSIPGRTSRRSTTTSMVWLRRRSRAISSSRASTWPSIRARVKPRARSAASSFLNSPLRPRTIGARTLIRSSEGNAWTRSRIWVSDCEEISLPHWGQCGVPMFAKSRRR